MSDKISHEGIIDQIDPATGHVRVRIVQTTACAACKIAGHCNASESKVKMVDVDCANKASALSVGEQVTVWASRDVAGRALLLGFGLPFLVMVLTLMGSLLLTGREGLSALLGIGALLPYYLVLWLCRKHIAERISFHLETNN